MQCRVTMLMAFYTTLFRRAATQCPNGPPSCAPLLVSQRGSVGVVAVVPVFGQAFDADGKTGGGVAVGLLSVVVAGFVLAFGLGMVFGVAVGATVQFVVLMCVSPGAGWAH
jgi:hypothetical protein